MSSVSSSLESEVTKQDVNEPPKKRSSSDFIAFPEMDEQEFQQWIELLDSRTGMRLPDNRRSFLVTNLAIRMRKLGLEKYRDYYELLHSGRGGHI